MNRRIVVFSGGSAANSLVDVFGKVAEDRACSLSYIIPISDNGGSSSELIRVFGGPGIGDVRSRLVRLIPEDPIGANTEKSALKTFFNHRLDPSPQEAKHEWLAIVEGHSPLWSEITSAKRELIRSFLNTINLEIVKRARPTSVFNFQSASVGNLFLTGARIFTGSFEAAIYLLGSITGVKDNVEVIPAINSNFSYHISAGLRDGTIIVGQNNISHPIAPTFVPTQPVSPATWNKRQSIDLLEHDRIEDANLPGSLPTLRKQNIDFQKSHTEELSSPIERIWYINPYGQEIRPAPNTKVLEALNDASCVIYSIGSLYTSILPCLVLRDVGNAIADPRIKFKVLILNGCLDRETPGYTARDFIEAIVRGCCGNGKEEDHEHKIPEEEWKKYITHVVYLEGPGTPAVDRTELKKLGIEAVRVYGRRAEPEVAGAGVILKNPLIDAVKSVDDMGQGNIANGNGNGHGNGNGNGNENGNGNVSREDIISAIGKDETAGMRYDGVGLEQALNAIFGGKAEKARRYTYLG
ncbi:52213239-1c76-4130-9ea9-9bf6e6ec2867 [Sclerotinia trifoliorum]|uniref:52213239-1c76-4130-9ea9-9bf6e6ec2867 n=1 Tax=Sclerotinia trifoliorum TaxID=28548 RepID=A0A8H2ZM94_9HELO|nr:52213239-1c76-4130-9ea9-9bf6e6ec2867 [Sclerotinia trifoliorum]